MRKQLWKLENGYIQIGDIGKSLVHYRHASTPTCRGAVTRLSSIEELQTRLRKGGAVLVEK